MARRYRPGPGGIGAGGLAGSSQLRPSLGRGRHNRSIVGQRSGSGAGAESAAAGAVNVLWFSRFHPVLMFGVAIYVVVWVQSGSGLVAMGVTPALMAAGGGAWVLFRARRTGVAVGQGVSRASAQAGRCRRVRRQWERACRAADLPVVPVLLPWQVRPVGVGAEQVVVTVDAASCGIARDPLLRGLVPMAEVIGGGCREAKLRPLGDSGLVQIVFVWGSALDQVVRPEHLADALANTRDDTRTDEDMEDGKDGTAAAGTAAGGGVAWFGLAEGHGSVDGEGSDGAAAGAGGGVVPVGLPLLNAAGECAWTPLLIGGQSGSGKSSVLWALLAGFITAGVPVRLWVADPAGGVELAALQDALLEGAGTDTFKVLRYASEPGEIAAMVEELHQVMGERMTRQRAARVRAHTPTVDEPVHLLVVDELLYLDKILKAGKDGPLGRIQIAGRKAGVSVIGCTQVAKVSDIGPCRDLFLQRMVFRMVSREATEAAFGSGAGWAEKAPAHRIPAAAKGVGYVVDTTGKNTTGNGASADEAVRFRAVYLDDAQIAQIARGQAPEALLRLSRRRQRPEDERQHDDHNTANAKAKAKETSQDMRRDTNGDNGSGRAGLRLVKREGAA